jgi:periplasmic divalent cation tolerance protein
MTDMRIVLTTAGSQSEARRIAEILVERKLAACVNIISRVQSIYRWEGKTQETEEWLLVIKSMKDSFAKLRDAIKELHPYELPECLSLTVDDGSEEYLNWVNDSMTR